MGNILLDWGWFCVLYGQQLEQRLPWVLLYQHQCLKEKSGSPAGLKATASFKERHTHTWTQHQHSNLLVWDAAQAGATRARIQSCQRRWRRGASGSWVPLRRPWQRWATRSGPPSWRRQQGCPPCPGAAAALRCVACGEGRQRSVTDGAFRTAAQTASSGLGGSNLARTCNH
jgi:hypothetical protein